MAVIKINTNLRIFKIVYNKEITTLFLDDMFKMIHHKLFELSEKSNSKFQKAIDDFLELYFENPDIEESDIVSKDVSTMILMLNCIKERINDICYNNFNNVDVVVYELYNKN